MKSEELKSQDYKYGFSTEIENFKAPKGLSEKTIRFISEIKLSNIIYAVDEEVKTLNCKKNSKRGCNNKPIKCITHDLWDQLDQHINGFFEKVKLQDLTKTVEK